MQWRIDAASLEAVAGTDDMPRWYVKPFTICTSCDPLDTVCVPQGWYCVNMAGVVLCEHAKLKAIVMRELLHHA